MHEQANTIEGGARTSELNWFDNDKCPKCGLVASGRTKLDEWEILAVGKPAEREAFIKAKREETRDQLRAMVATCTHQHGIPAVLPPNPKQAEFDAIDAEVGAEKDA